MVVVASAGLWSGIGLLPSFAYGPNVALHSEHGPWLARLAAHAALSQDEQVGALGASFRTVGAGLDLCRVLPIARPGAWALRGCAGTGLDAIVARGKGGESRDAVRIAVLAFLGVGGSWRPGSRVRLDLDVRAGPSLRRPKFGVESSAGKATLLDPAVVRVEGTIACGFVF
jgi:hypothetical protein